MVGRNINKRLIHFIICATFAYGFNSCRETCERDGIDRTVYNYIDYLKSADNMGKRNFMVHVTIDSSSSDYIGYRINTFPVLLDLNELPNKIDLYKGFRIAHFTKKIIGKGEIQKMNDSLFINDFYIKDEITIDSNYPEWILLENKKASCTQLIKNTGYQELGFFIDKIDNNSTD